MAIFDNNLDYTKLIQFTDGSLQLASFVQIRNALIERFKNIYGNDIDVSPASADGQYINSISLLINNIFQTIKRGYDSLDPAIATGQYLDTLCSYNNITRIMPTASKAQLYIYNSTGSDIEIDKLTFIDKSNILWVWDNGGVNFKFKSKTYQLIEVTCNELGSISAPGTSAFYYFGQDGLLVETDDPSKQDWDDSRLYGNSLINGTIYQTVEQLGLWVWQYKDADVGEDEETDEALRSRRYMMLGNTSVTVLEGLKGNLLNITGIKDCYIFNNASSSPVTLTDPNGYTPIADTTTVDEHSIYVAIRYKEGVKIDPQVIAKIIYNKLTPGILTNETTDPLGESLQYDIPRTSEIVDTIYWKKCGTISPEISIDLYCKKEIYDYPTDSANNVVTSIHPATSAIELEIIKNLQKYISDIKIDDYLTISNLMTNIQQSDIQKNGMSTYFTQSGYIDTVGTYKYPANLSYFKYNDLDFLFEYDNLDFSSCTLSVGGTTPLYIKLNATAVSLSLSDPTTFDLIATICPTTSTGTLTFSTSDSTIADVDANGVISLGSNPSEEDTAIITVTETGTNITATCEVTIIA